MTRRSSRSASASTARVERAHLRLGRVSDPASTSRDQLGQHRLLVRRGRARSRRPSRRPTTLRLLSSTWLSGQRGISPPAKPIDHVAAEAARARSAGSAWGPPTGSTTTSAPPPGELADPRLQVLGLVVDDRARRPPPGPRPACSSPAAGRDRWPGRRARWRRRWRPGPRRRRPPAPARSRSAATAGAAGQGEQGGAVALDERRRPGRAHGGPGTRTSDVAGTATRSANPPSPTMAITRSPGAQPSTPSPTAMTVPATSLPGTERHRRA